MVFYMRSAKSISIDVNILSDISKLKEKKADKYPDESTLFEILLKLGLDAEKKNGDKK